jgi:hypothetical protein
MPASNQSGHAETLIIPGQTLRGSTQDLLLELDRRILGLLALRQRIACEVPPPWNAGRRTSLTRDLVNRITATLGFIHD